MSLAEEVAAQLPDGLVQGYGGVVTAIGTSAVTVDIRGALIDCGCAAGYSPGVGDNVLVLRVGNTNSWVAAFSITAGAGAWQPLTLMNGFTNRGAPGAVLSFLKESATKAVLVGHLNVPAGVANATQVALLPDWCRPISEQIILARKGANTSPATVGITADGIVRVYDPPASGLIQLSPTTFRLDR